MVEIKAHFEKGQKFSVNWISLGHYLNYRRLLGIFAFRSGLFWTNYHPP